MLVDSPGSLMTRKKTNFNGGGILSISNALPIEKSKENAQQNCEIIPERWCSKTSETKMKQLKILRKT